MSAIHAKIQKLLALGKDGANEHESARAMELATKLMMQHNIDASAFVEKPKVGMGEAFEFDKKWHMLAAQAAGVLYGCRPLTMGSEFRFAGREDNVDAAQQTYTFIERQVEQLYKVSLPSGMSQQERARYRRDFKEACALRVYYRAKKIVDDLLKAGIEATPESSGSTALVVVESRKLLEQEVEQFFAEIGTQRTRARSVSIKSSAGARDGNRQGENVKLQRSVQ